MSWSFKAVTQKQFDKLTEEYFGDPKLIWQHLISGEKHFDSCDFLGALKDLAALPDWKEAFTGISGLEGFIDRLGSFFELNGDLSPDENGRQYLYFSPKNKEASQAKLIKLMTQHLAECAKLADFINDKDWSERFSVMPVEWIEPDNLVRNNPDSEIEAYLWDTWGDVFSDNKKPDWSHFHYCLAEASYGLAGSYSLQQYLMQDFYTLDFDLSHQFELQWVYSGCYFFADGKCYVSKAEGR